MTAGRVRLVAMAVAVAAAAAVAGCGVPSSGDFEAFDDDLGLTQTTTTTIEVPDSLAPTTTAAQTTTTIATEPVTLYFLAGNQVSSVSIALTRPAATNQVVTALVQGPPAGQVGTGLRTALPRLFGPTVENTRGGVVVDVPDGFFESIPPADQRLAVAQLVLTLTDRGGVGTVQFTRDGAPIAVPKGTGESTEPGEVVYREDYSALLATEQPAVTTSTVDSPTTSTTGAP